MKDGLSDFFLGCGGVLLCLFVVLTSVLAYVAVPLGIAFCLWEIAHWIIRH